MARLPRFVLVGHPQHIIFRGNNRELFASQIDEISLAQMREATNKAWVLWSDYFKQKIADQLNRRTEKSARGGDRKSDAYQENRTKGV